MGGRGSGSSKPRQDWHPSYTTEELAERLGIDEELASDIAQAVWNFTGDGYAAVRRDQQAGVPNRDADVLEELIRVAPAWAGGPTYRGVLIDDEGLYDELTTVGAVVDPNYGTASWTSWRRTAEHMSENYEGASIVFVVRSKMQRHGTSVRSLSSHQTEDEVLVSKDARYRVQRVEPGSDRDRRTYVYLREV